MCVSHPDHILQGRAPTGQALCSIRRRFGIKSQDLQLDPLTLRTGELSEGGQRDESVGDGMHWVSHAGLVGGTARLDAADGVCFLLAEAAEKHSPGRLVAKLGQ